MLRLIRGILQDSLHFFSCLEKGVLGLLFARKLSVKRSGLETLPGLESANLSSKRARLKTMHYSRTNFSVKEFAAISPPASRGRPDAVKASQKLNLLLKADLSGRKMNRPG